METWKIGAVKVNCSEMPAACPLRQPEFGARPWPEPPCSHFTPLMEMLCPSSCAPACAFTRTMSPE